MRALDLAQAALLAARADEADALAQVERSGLARFAGSRVHQPTLVTNESVSIRLVRDGRVGTAATNRTDPDGLQALVDRAAAAADRSPADPGFPGLPARVKIPEVEGWDSDTAALPPSEQADRAWAAISAVNGFGAFGYFTSGEVETAVASTTGIAAAQSSTDADVLVIAASEDASGFAEATSWKAGELDSEAVACEAAEKAARTRGSGGIDPGTYRAVLEPYAIGELLWYFAFSSLGALAFLEGRSYLSGRLDEAIFDPAFSLFDDGLDPGGLPRAFDFEGVPKQRVTLVDAGIAKDVVWDRRTAGRAGRESTGHALPPSQQAFGPVPFNLSLEPGDATVDELVEGVEDGIYVTRLHYLGVVDPREGIITGMTRDGTFRIEGGRVTRPLGNLRFSTSFPKLAHDLVGLGHEPKLVNLNDYYDERHAFGALVPALATAAFTVVGVGSSPGF